MHNTFCLATHSQGRHIDESTTRQELSNSATRITGLTGEMHPYC
jgi:hypothetical protein